MEIISEDLMISKTARFFMRPILSGTVRKVWILVHGYAQLAPEFLSEFEFINNENEMLFAPEGLSKFYFRDKVGASWMTKEDRKNEISDYINYLNTFTKKIKNDYGLNDTSFNLLGFSQGVHTATRFFIKGDHQFDNLILCSSDFPKDVDFEMLNEKLKKSKMYFIHGTNDSAISNKKFDGSVKLLIQKNVEFEDISFDGDHVLNKKLLHDLFCK